MISHAPTSNQQIRDYILQFDQVKVLVVGDVMLDQYWFGDTERISPEAPVPITKIEKTEFRAGGAANVAQNIASLGAKTSRITSVGEDQAAQDLENLLHKNSNIETHFIHDSKLKTTIKLRVIARNQQLLRIDFENTPHNEAIVCLKQTYLNLLPNFDVVVFSDYDKGSLKHVADLVQLAKAANRLVLIDPKGEDYSKYRQADMITPNRQELKAVVGSWSSEAELTQKAQQLREELAIHTLLLTRSEEGLSLYQADWQGHDAITPQEVFDVSGAGDTIIAAAALALASQIPNPLLMKIANAAAGVVIVKLGTATCTQTELLHKLNLFVGN